MVTFAYEPLEFILKTGLPDLCLECWNHMDDGFYRDIFSPDWRMYKEQEDMNNLGFLSMREDENLIGYAVVIVNRDIHQEGLKIAVIHDVYVKEEKRGYATEFFKYIQDFSRELGAYRVDVAERLSFDKERGGCGKFYEFLGFKPMEVIWSRVL